MSIAIMTDSNSGITPHEASKLGVFLLPMPFYVNEKLCFENIDLTPKEFFRPLAISFPWEILPMPKDASMQNIEKITASHFHPRPFSM